MKIIIEGKQGEGKSIMAKAVAAVVEIRGMTYVVKDSDGSRYTNNKFIGKPQVEIITRQTK